MGPVWWEGGGWCPGAIAEGVGGCKEEGDVGEFEDGRRPSRR